MLKNFFKFGKKKKGEEEQKSELENQLDKEIQESEDEIQKIKKETEKEIKKAADEILKFKSLLDQGILTQEEFDKKKKELLG